MSTNDETPRPASDERPKRTEGDKNAIHVSDETLRRLQQEKRPILPGPKEPVKTA
jgi:hypothetical protein